MHYRILTVARKCALLLAFAALPAALSAGPASATADFKLDFTFSGSGRLPSPEKFRTGYILACVPAGSRTWGGYPATSKGTWDLKTPSYKVKGQTKEYTAQDVHTYLWTCNIKPPRVSGITVTPE